MSKTLKRCTMCGTDRETEQAYCPACGAAAFSYVEIPDEVPAESPEASAFTEAPQQAPYEYGTPAVQDQPSSAYQAYGTSQPYASQNPYGPTAAAPQMASAPSAPAEEKHENVIAGIGGAILFSLGGVALYVLLYQIGFIASISAFVTFALAAFGYGLFCGTKKTTSLPSIITPIVVTVVMIVLAVFLAMGVALFIELKKYGYNITLGDVMKAFPELLEDKEIRGELIKDLLFALLFGALGTVGSIIRSFKARKAAKNAQ